MAVLAGCGSGRGGSPPELSAAIVAGDVEEVRVALGAGADPDSPVVNGMTPLMRAAARGDTAVVSALLDGGADVDLAGAEGLTATHVAAQLDRVAVLGALVDAGADRTARSANGMTVLHHAAVTGSTDVVTALAGAGVDLDARSGVVSQGHGYPRDVGATPLGLAARAGQWAMVDLLVELGADVDGRSSSGHTPVLLAVFAGVEPVVVERLVAAGADVSVEADCEAGCSVEGGDALAWARELGRDEIAAVLVRALGGE